MGAAAFQRLSIPDVKIVTPPKSEDHRGYVMESYSARDYAQGGIPTAFVQDNQSLSVQSGVIRGLHFQMPPHAQAKLVRVVAGAVFDVAVDLRKGSPTYGHWCAATLTADAGEQMFIPKGFAHGFCTLAPNTIVTYKLDDYFAPQSATGISWSSPSLAIDWPIEGAQPIISAKDAVLTDFALFDSPFVYEGPPP
jgi:dTDP-4-dehydrorhamnose 3,5-epimerase